MRIFTNEKLVITTLVAVITAAAFVAILYFSLGKIFKLSIDETSLINEFKKTYGLETVLKNFKLETTPTLGVVLSVDELIISEPGNESVILDIKNGRLGVRLVPLLFKKIAVTSITASNINLEGRRDKDGNINLLKYFGKKGEYRFDIKKTHLNIGKYNLRLNDEALGNIITVEGDTFSANRIDRDKYLSFVTYGKISLEQKLSPKINVSDYKLILNSRMPIVKNTLKKDFKIDAEIKNLELEPYSQYLKLIKNLGIREAKGSVNLKITNGASKVPLFLEADFNDLFFSFICNGKFSTIKSDGEGKLTANFNTEGNTLLKIENAAFNSPGLSAYVKGKIQGYQKQNPVFDIDAELKDSQASALISLLPDCIKTPEDSIRKLKQYKGNGNIDGKIKVTGSFPALKIFGKLSFDEVRFEDEDPETHSGEGFCEFKGNNLALNLRVNLPNSQYVDIIGVSEMFGKPKANFKIISTPDIDARIAHTVAVKAKDVIGFQLGPLPIMKVSGVGEINLETNGTKEKATVNGFFNLKGINASLNGINTTAANTRGKLEFKDHNVIYDNLNTTIEGAPAKISGRASNSGKVDITFDISKMKLADGIKISLTSPMTKDLLKSMQLVKNIQGEGNIKLNIKGEVRNFRKIAENTENLASSFEPTLKLEFLGADTLVEPNIEVKNLRGTVDYNKDFKLKLNGRMYNSNFELDGTTEPLKQNGQNIQKIDLNFNSKDFAFNDFLNFLENGLQASYKPEQAALIDFAKKLDMSFAPKINLRGEVPFDGKTVDLRKVQLEGMAFGLNPQTSSVRFNSGNIKFKGQKVLLETLNVSLWGANIICQGNVDKIFDHNQIANLKIQLRRFPLARLNAQENLTNLPEEVKKILSDFEDFKGFISGNIEVVNNKYGGGFSFANISALHKPKKTNLELKSGEIKMTDNRLNLHALNIAYGQLPVYLDANISNINTANPFIDASFSTNISEEAADTIINQNLTYPVKIKGELVVKGKMKGTVDNYNIIGNAVLNPQADISYMGAGFGDIDTKREFSLNANFKKDRLRIHNMGYMKYLSSQNNRLTPHPIVRMSGGVYLKGTEPYFDNFAIRTQNQAPAGLFNIAFKKSILKQGNFSCDLNLNGNAADPLIMGNISFDGLNIPLYNSEIKQAAFNLKRDVVSGTLTGQGLKSDIKITTEIKNSAKLPLTFKKLDIESKKVSLDKILEEMAFISSMQKNPGVVISSNQIILNPADIVIEEGRYQAEEVNFHKIKARNLDTKFSQDSAARFKVDNLTFDIAGGQIVSTGTYEFDKARLNLNSQIKDCEANVLSEGFLGIKDQLFGKMNGEMTLSGSQLHTSKGLETVSAKAQFEVKKGKMPKLGSLEYLLRAGNFIKSGIFGLTLNNIIEVIIPYKTGEFESIKGNLLVENGKVEKLELYSKGENLSLYATGTYDLTTGHADIDILGRLSKKVSNLLGPIGNASLNSLFNLLSAKKLRTSSENELLQSINKVPLIELSGEDVRMFAVKIIGDLNKDGYVKSFDWLD